MRVRLGLAAAALAALSICAAVTAVTAVSHPAASGADPVTGIWSEWPDWVSCEGGLPFPPVTTFSDPADDEQGQFPAERALARVLASGELPRVRQHGWRHLAETPRTAEFIAGPLSEPRPGSVSKLQWIELEKRDGRWQLGAFSLHCTLRSVRRGVLATPWKLAPGQRLTPETRRLRVDVEPQTCNPIAGVRVQRREVHEHSGRLVMTLWVRLIERRASTTRLSCPPQIKRILVELPEKLGPRRLFDGSTYPPAAASRSAFLPQ